MDEHIYTNILFIALERHMMENYTYLNSKLKNLGLNYQVIYLPEVPTAIGYKQRLKEGKSYFTTLKSFLKENFPEGIKNTLIIYSNSEGFIFANKSRWMPILSHCKEIELQHGLMALDFPHPILRRILNAMTENLLGMSLIGKGFGGVKADGIVVWGEQYKNFLVNTRKWDKDKVYVSGRMLKPFIERVFVNQEATSALFLLQDYAKAIDMGSKEQESYFYKIAQYLSTYYKKVIVRKHPKMPESSYDIFKDLENITISNGSLTEDLQRSDKIYSFTSSALINAALSGKEVVAIKLPKIPDSHYEAFQRIVKVDELKNYLEEFSGKDNEAKINSSFFYEMDNVDEIINDILRNE